MTLIWSAACLFFLIGFAMRTWGEIVEMRHLRLATLLLGGGENDDRSNEPVYLGTVIRRTRMCLGAAKVVRIAALFLLIPSTVILIRALVFGEMAGTQNQIILADVLAIVSLFILFLGLHGLALWSTGRVFASNEPIEPPAWVLDREVPAPLLMMSGWYVWERIVTLFDFALAGINASRPQAQLVEKDDAVRLDVSMPHAANQPDTVRSITTVKKKKGERTEHDMIRAIQRLDRTFVREIMRPINQVTAIRLRDYNPRLFLQLSRRTGFTRIPCYRDQITNLIGFINVYDILDADETPHSLEAIVTKPLFVPEVARVNNILSEMIAKRQHVAIVFDEFGGTSGWLSREDIFEEIIGDVEDEYERPRQMILEVKNGFLVDPSTDLDDLRDEIGLALPKTNCDTLAGYVYNRLGRVPRRGETIEEKGWRIRVAGMDNHRIRKLRLTPPKSESPTS